MDWSGLTSPKLHWYDSLFWLLPLLLLTFTSLDLHTFLKSGGEGYLIGSECAGWAYRTHTRYIAIGVVMITVLGFGLSAYVLPPRRFLRPAGRLICYAVTSLVTLTFCVLALEAIGVAHIL